ncbi:hypothetical protein K504DRAFT_462407 [Pleomassaria siparia CBS 279.74]|uniref:F-box domain-containing protein n=1 Tax=Pleomassaria siparia CBS 279.74 TaxID=1314801 RepID=A0A6G1KMA7_9PLEO|nr:hypothetical protein K504DRAFT_462407 [Pleomassaria siparia CBS 279.74]
MELLDLCYDVLIRILEEINPADLAACAQTSWGFNNFIKENNRLHKAHYLQHFDDPRTTLSYQEPQWTSELHSLVKCQKILLSKKKDVKRENFRFIASTVERLLSSGNDDNDDSLNKHILRTWFGNSQNLDIVMSRSSLYERCGTASQQPANEEEDRQLSAKMHCLHGIPGNSLGRRSLSTHPHARSRVYDLRNYTDQTKWGPFREDGSMRVDWEMIESIMIVLAYNSNMCCRRNMPRFQPIWSDPFEGVVKHGTQTEYKMTILKEPEIPIEMKDPYNISGLWSRIVCFMDYNDLYAFNFASRQVSPDEPRAPINTEEAIRHILMRLQITKLEPPGPFDNPNLPIAHFTGKSRSVDVSWDPNANSKIRGTVSLTPEGEVRWNTISVFYGGEERWRSEGIQVGGLNTRRGVVGSWFDKDYDAHGPAGPTAFWKVTDTIFNKMKNEEDTIDEESDTDDDESEW